MQKILRYTTAVPYGHDILGMEQYVGTTDIKLVPVLHARCPEKMQLLLWTDERSMLQYLNGGPYSSHHQIINNLTDVSKAVGKIYCALKFRVGFVTTYGYIDVPIAYGYIFNTPYVLPHYDTPIVGWTVNAVYVDEVADSI